MRQGVNWNWRMKARGGNGRLIDLLDLHVGAGLLPELLQHLTDGRPRGVAVTSILNSTGLP